MPEDVVHALTQAGRLGVTPDNIMSRCLES